MRSLGILASVGMIGYAIYESDRRGYDFEDITAVSIAYFALMLVVFILAARAPGGRRGLAIFMAVAAVGMAAWSTMLGGHIGFNEVFFAWVGYAVLAALILMLPPRSAKAG